MQYLVDSATRSSMIVLSKHNLEAEGRGYRTTDEASKTRHAKKVRKKMIDKDKTREENKKENDRVVYIIDDC